MTNDTPTTQDPVDADYEIVVPDKREINLDTYRSLLRLAVGGVAMGTDELLSRVRAWEEDNPQDANNQTDIENAPALDQARYALIGLLFAAPEIAAEGIIRGVEATERVGQTGEKILGPIVRSRAFGPVRRRYEAAINRAGNALDSWVQVGQGEEMRGRSMASEVLPQTIDTVVTQFNDDEAIQALIRQQAGDYLDYLSEHPVDLNDLVQSVGDDYIHYLNEENPDEIQTLIQGQSIGLAGEVVDEVRERTVTADSFVEMIFRSLMRRSPRQDLPGPPPEVIHRATVTRIQEHQQSHQESEEDD